MARSLFVWVLLLANAAMLYRFLVSDQGVFAYLEMKKKRDALEVEKTDLEKRRLEFSREIIMLKENGEFTEMTIRSQTNYLRENELLYIVPEPAAGGHLAPEGGHE